MLSKVLVVTAVFSLAVLAAVGCGEDYGAGAIDLAATDYGAGASSTDMVCFSDNLMPYQKPVCFPKSVWDAWNSADSEDDVTPVDTDETVDGGSGNGCGNNCQNDGGTSGNGNGGGANNNNDYGQCVSACAKSIKNKNKRAACVKYCKDKWKKHKGKRDRDDDNDCGDDD